MSDDERDAVLMDVSKSVSKIEGILTGGNGAGLVGDVRKLRSDFDSRVAVPERCPGLAEIRAAGISGAITKRDKIRIWVMVMALAASIALGVIGLVK